MGFKMNTENNLSLKQYLSELDVLYDELYSEIDREDEHIDYEKVKRLRKDISRLRQRWMESHEKRNEDLAKLVESCKS